MIKKKTIPQGVFFGGEAIGYDRSKQYEKAIPIKFDEVADNSEIPFSIFNSDNGTVSVSTTMYTVPSGYTLHLTELHLCLILQVSGGAGAFVYFVTDINPVANRLVNIRNYNTTETIVMQRVFPEPIVLRTGERIDVSYGYSVAGTQGRWTYGFSGKLIKNKTNS